MLKRDWDKWDDPGVAEAIDTIWRDDTYGSEKKEREYEAGITHKLINFPMTQALEVGCGTGLMYKELVPKVIDNSSYYLGVDTSTNMLKIARDRYPEGRFSYGDLYSLPFRDRAFDVVLCYEVLGHLPDIQKPIEELTRVSKKLVVFTAWVTRYDVVLHDIEEVKQSSFLLKFYPPKVIEEAIVKASKGGDWTVRTFNVSGVKFLYGIEKGE
jgi:ubiquinone/menaquinone biosynthesis C-methylase UbiE